MLTDIEQDREAGATAEGRMQALKRAKSRNIALSATAVIAAVATCFQRSPLRPPAAVVLALVPVAALYLLNTKPLLYALGKSKRDSRSELAIALFAPALGFFASTVDENLVSRTPLLPFIVAVAIAFVAGFFLFGRQGARTPGFAVMVLMCAGFYSYGLVASSDTLFDHGQSTTYQTQVMGKHIAHGKSTDYYLDFGAWGPLVGANKMGVPYGLYETAQPGDKVCFEVHPGTLRAPWYMRVNCDTEEMQSAP